VHCLQGGVRRLPVLQAGNCGAVQRVLFDEFERVVPVSCSARFRSEFAVRSFGSPSTTRTVVSTSCSQSVKTRNALARGRQRRESPLQASGNGQRENGHVVLVREDCRLKLQVRIVLAFQQACELLQIAD